MPGRLLVGELVADILLWLLFLCVSYVHVKAVVLGFVCLIWQFVTLLVGVLTGAIMALWLSSDL